MGAIKNKKMHTGVPNIFISSVSDNGMLGKGAEEATLGREGQMLLTKREAARRISSPAAIPMSPRGQHLGSGMLVGDP